MGTNVRARDPPSSSARPAMARASDEPVMGVAVSTRNYRALLAHSGVAAADARDDGASDRTVVGLPVETRNYAALLSKSAARRPHEPVALGVAVESGNLRPRRASNQRETETIGEDEDAVLGLPISTGNYKAMYRQDDNMKVRQRGYSDLAESTGDRPSIAGRRSTPEYGAAGKNHHGSHSGRSKTADSCFDRRTSGAIVPHKGWLYIQSPTVKAWKRYFAVLSGLDFRYSSEPGRASKGFGMIQSVQRWDGKPWGIRFVYTSGSEVLTYCASEQEREEWVEFVGKALERLQHSSGHSKTTYTLAADQHEGYLFKQDRAKKWVLNFFTLRSDGYMQCRDDANTPADPKCSGYVRSVAFADVHNNALAIELVSGDSVFVYTETYDDRMLWYAAISAAASANGQTPLTTRQVKSSYVQTALPNHSGWLYKQMGLFKSWKRVYCTLHGLEFGFAKDVNSTLEECGKIEGVKDWDGKQHGLEIRFANGVSWKVYAESYETAKHWRTVIADVCRHSDRFNIKNYLASRRRKKMRPVFGGWLTTHKGSSRVRQFYVMDGNMLGVADDVDNLLQPIGSVVDIGATRDTANGMLIAFADGTRLKVSGDSVGSAKAWYDCLSSTL